MKLRLLFLSPLISLAAIAVCQNPDGPTHLVDLQNTLNSVPEIFYFIDPKLSEIARNQALEAAILASGNSSTRYSGFGGNDQCSPDEHFKASPELHPDRFEFKSNGDLLAPENADVRRELDEYAQSDFFARRKKIYSSLFSNDNELIVSSYHLVGSLVSTDRIAYCTFGLLPTKTSEYRFQGDLNQDQFLNPADLVRFRIITSARDFAVNWNQTRQNFPDLELPELIPPTAIKIDSIIPFISALQEKRKTLLSQVSQSQDALKRIELKRKADQIDRALKSLVQNLQNQELLPLWDELLEHELKFTAVFFNQFHFLPNASKQPTLDESPDNLTPSENLERYFRGRFDWWLNFSKRNTFSKEEKEKLAGVYNEAEFKKFKALGERLRAITQKWTPITPLYAESLVPFMIEGSQTIKLPTEEFVQKTITINEPDLIAVSNQPTWFKNAEELIFTKGDLKRNDITLIKPAQGHSMIPFSEPGGRYPGVNDSLSKQANRDTLQSAVNVIKAIEQSALMRDPDFARDPLIQRLHADRGISGKTWIEPPPGFGGEDYHTNSTIVELNNHTQYSWDKLSSTLEALPGISRYLGDYAFAVVLENERRLREEEKRNPAYRDARDKIRSIEQKLADLRQQISSDPTPTRNVDPLNQIWLLESELGILRGDIMETETPIRIRPYSVEDAFLKSKTYREVAHRSAQVSDYLGDSVPMQIFEKAYHQLNPESRWYSFDINLDGEINSRDVAHYGPLIHLIDKLPYEEFMKLRREQDRDEDDD